MDKQKGTPNNTVTDKGKGGWAGRGRGRPRGKCIIQKETKPYKPKPSYLSCSGCNKEVTRTSIIKSSVQVLYDPFSSRSDYRLLCANCSISANHAVALIQIFTPDFLKSIANLNAFLSKEAVDVLKFFRFLENICLKLNLPVTLPHEADVKYAVNMELSKKTGGKPDFLFHDEAESGELDFPYEIIDEL